MKNNVVQLKVIAGEVAVIRSMHINKEFSKNSILLLKHLSLMSDVGQFERCVENKMTIVGGPETAVTHRVTNRLEDAKPIE